MPRLVVVRGPAVGLEYPVRSDVVLGRDPRCQVLLGHREVSGQHARLYRLGDRYFLEDLGSRNGTYVNNKPVQRQPLSDGDEIAIGRTALRFDALALPEPSLIKTTDPGSMTVELDATRDVFPVGLGAAISGVRRIENVLKLLCNVSRSIGALAGLKTTLDEIAATMLEVFPPCGRVMILLSADGVSLEPVVTRYRTDPEAPSNQYSETIVRKARSERRAILTVDALNDDRFSASRSVVDLRLRSLMCAPIVHRDRVLGVVELDTLESSRMFTEDDLNLMTGIVAQLAFAVANAQLYDELRGLVGSTVTSLTTMLGLRAPPLLAHSERVSRLALMMAKRLELVPVEVEALRVASLLHDIGLLAFPDEVIALGLRHPGPLTAEQEADVDPTLSAMLLTHPEKGAEMLAPIRPLASVANLILCHHEHFDGRGYPRGLSGAEIPIGARILAVADAFDALTSGEADSRRTEAALEALRVGAGRQFDPELVALFEPILQARQRLEARRGG